MRPSSCLLLPFEVFEEIIEEIDGVPDLINIALTCRSLYHIVSPGHLEFRELRCDPRRAAFWTALASCPTLAGRCRKLDLIDETLRPALPVCLPGLFLKELKEKDDFRDRHKIQATLAPLIKVLSLMKNLVVLRWKVLQPSSRPPTSILDQVFVELKRSCFRLSTLQVDYTEPSSTEFTKGIVSPRWQLSNLTRVSLVMCCDTFMPIHYKLPLSEHVLFFLVNSCPDLVDLLIEVPFTGGGLVLPQLLTSGNWQFLRRLSLKGNLILYEPMEDSPTRGAKMATFLKRHSLLKRLLLWGREMLYPGGIPSLPRLRSLYFRTPYGFEIKKMVPYDVAQRLIYLSDPGHETLIPSQLPMPSLQQLSLTKSVSLILLAKVALAVPKLKRLKLVLGYHEDYELLIETLLKFQHLTHLAGVLNDFHPREEEESLISRLATIKSLKYIYTTKDQIIIERCADGAFSKARLENLYMSNKHPDSWGNFFTDVIDLFTR